MKMNWGQFEDRNCVSSDCCPSPPLPHPFPYLCSIAQGDFINFGWTNNPGWKKNERLIYFLIITVVKSCSEGHKNFLCCVSAMGKGGAFNLRWKVRVWRNWKWSLGKAAKFTLGISSIMRDEQSERWQRLIYHGPSQPCSSVVRFHIL